MKQQNNEREDKAIQALNKALELDPSYREAWLAIAVSYTNENQREDAVRAIERWMGLVSGDTFDAALEFKGVGLDAVNAKHRELVEKLMQMARRSASSSVDADVQIALGVLLNMTEVC